MKQLFPILIIIFLFGCTKEETATEDLAPEPSISFVSITPDTVENFKNSVTLTIKYSRGSLTCLYYKNCETGDG